LAIIAGGTGGWRGIRREGEKGRRGEGEGERERGREGESEEVSGVRCQVSGVRGRTYTEEVRRRGEGEKERRSEGARPGKK
jgi:hypothetical protein